MEALTREQAIEYHRRLWNWIADETLKKKRKVYKNEYPLFVRGTHDCQFNCYACEYRLQTGDYCRNCIVDWGKRSDGMPLRCFNMGAPFEEWERIEDYKRAAELARQIAELPERKIQRKGVKNNGSTYQINRT